MIRASISIEAKSCKIEKKNTSFNTFWPQKNTHISGCKIVHKCTSATVTVHICTVTVTLAFNILHFFLPPSPHSLIFSFSLSPLSFFISGPSIHRSVQPHSHLSIQQATTDEQIAAPPLMSESQHRQRRTKKQTAEEASHATFALAVPPSITAKAHSSIRSSKLSLCHHRLSLKLYLISGFWGFDPL